MGFGLHLLIEAEDVIGSDKVDDPGGGHAVDLFLEDVAHPLPVVRDDCLHCGASVQAFDDLRDVEAGLHVEVGEGLFRVVEAARVLFLQLVNHHPDDAPGREDNNVPCTFKDLLQA